LVPSAEGAGAPREGHICVGPAPFGTLISSKSFLKSSRFELGIVRARHHRGGSTMSDSIPTPKCAKGAGAPLSLPAKPKRRRGGQPGNLNATKYTWRALARRGHLVRAEDRWVLPAMEQYKRELESDKPDATAGERRLIELCAMARAIQALMLARTDEDGIAAQLTARQSVAQELRGYMSLELSALNALGLERRAKPAGTVWDWKRPEPSTDAPTIDVTPEPERR
jgi:hypothetical protein